MTAYTPREMQAAVSVIIPFYNNERYIKTCLNSVLCQKIDGKIEIFCINDGSTDSTASILQEYENKFDNLRVIHKKNGGQSTARNTGLELATGRYIMFIDGDDRLGGINGTVGDEIQALLEPMYQGAELSIGNLSIIYEANEHMREGDAKYYKLPFVGNHDISPREIGHIHASPCSKISDREIIEKYKLRFPVGLHFEDAYWCSCYSAVATKAAGISKDVYTYFRHKSGTMNSVFNDGNTDLAFEHSLIAEKVYEFYRDNNLLSKEGMQEWVTEMFESFCNFSRWHASPTDELLVMAKMGEILRRQDVDCSRSIFLSGMKSGKIVTFRDYLVEPSVSSDKPGFLKRLKYAFTGRY